MATGYAPPQQPYGAPPQPYGAQPYGAPPQPYGAQPYGAQPQPYYQQQWELQPQPQQQHFATQGQPMTGVMPPSYDGSVNPETGLPTKFNPKPKFNDLWALVLFLIQLAGFVVLSYFVISKVVDDERTRRSGTLNGLFSTNGIISLVIAVGVSAVFSIIYYFLTQAFPRQIIKVTFALSILFYFALAAYYLYLKVWVVGIIMAVFAILYATSWFYWRSRIPFATVMLRAVTGISRQYPATFALSFVGLFIQIVYSIYFMTVISGIYEDHFGTRSSSAGKFYGLAVFSFFSYFWTSQVFTNIVHTTVCGVFATYYFMKGSPQGMSASPTLASLKRSCTTSLGTICFGSLIIAIIQTLRTLANMARGESDGIMAFVACLLECILACLQEIAEFVNKYAFAQVATYGKPYIRAAKDTWTILRDRGVEQIINDCLIGNVWSMAAIFGGALSGIASYLYLDSVNATFGDDRGFTIFMIVVGVILGIQIVFTVGTVIDSGVVATFVCLAEDPAALARTKPDLFEQIRLTWPEVVQGVH